MNLSRDDLNGRFIKKSSSDHRQKRISNLNRDSFISLQNNSSTPAAGSALYLDHSYQSLQCSSTQPSYDEDSFDHVNETFFSGKLKTLISSRFVVDLHILCTNMKCLNCSRNVLLEDAVGVLPIGVSGYLIVRCRTCSSFIRVAMDKEHTGQHQRGPKVLDVNSKLATAMYHIGIGPTQVNNVLSVVNLPTPSTKTIQRRCEEVGSKLEELASESTDLALQREVSLTNEVAPSAQTPEMTDSADRIMQRIGIPAPGELPKTGTLPMESSTSSETNFNEIAASADGTYQRRGSGRCHNSLSGAASLIGKRTGKVIAFAARYKRCRICDVAKTQQRDPRQHTCRKNWKKSAKAMEPDMVVEMLKSTKEKNAMVTTLIGDDDSTAYNRARVEVCPSMVKVSDKNHVKKNLSSQLYKLKPQYKELSVKTINAIMKGFSYMLSQAKGEVEHIRNGLPSVVLHQFGDHSQCGSWCAILKEPSRKHRNLPWGADLTNIELKRSLLSVFKKLDPEKLSKLDSSNSNESFNNTLRSKAPKDKHYSDGGSLAHRLSAAVCQKNEGYAYVSKVHKKLGLSPGTLTERRAKNLDKDVLRKKKRSKTKEFKLRRLQLKSERSTETKSSEIREGDTYLSNVLDDVVEPDLLEIPGPNEDSGDHVSKIFFYDLETTGLGRESSIVQLAATYEDHVFNRYITPNQEMSEEASRVTGINYNFMTNEMVHNNKSVSHSHALQVLLDFIQFLMLLGKNCVLVAHNNKVFDSIILYNQLKYHSLWNHFCKYVTGFCDTLPYFKKLYPGLESYKQDYIAMKLLQESYSAHNALDDCKMLQRLVHNVGDVDTLLSKFYYSSSQITSHGVQPSLESFEHMLKNGVISRQIYKKIEGSSLTHEHLKAAFQREGFDGIYYLLTELNEDGKPRISKNHNVIKKVFDYFCSLI